MRRFFVKNLLFIITLNLLVKPVWVFMIDRTVQNRVGHEAYGTYQALLAICSIFQILLDFGITNYNTNIVSQNPSKLRTLFPAMLTTKLLLTSIYILIVVAVAWQLGYQKWELLLLSGILSIILLNSLMQYLRSNMAALRRFRIDGFLSIMDRLMMIGICGVLLYHPATRDRFRIEWFIYAQIASYGITAIVAFYLIYRVTRVRPSLSFDTREVFETMRKSLPFALMVFLMGIHMTSDRFLVERIGSKDEAGIYASAYRLLDQANMFGIMFAGVLLPMFGKLMATKQSVQPILKLSVNMLLPFAFTLFGVTYFWGTDIMQLLYKGAGTYDGIILAWVMAAFPAYCIMYTYSTLLTANGNTHIMIRISVVGVIISLALNMYLIPRYQAMGAAITACITQVILALCYILFCGKELKLPHNAKWIAAHLSFLTILIAGGILIYNLSLNWVIAVSLFLILSLAGIFTFRFLSIAGVKTLLNKKN